MDFGGLQKTSLIDYPGKISCVLFVSGCNFRCPYCHNPDLAMGCPKPSRCISERELFLFLERRKGFLEGVVISGGEPTLLDDLPNLCGKIQQVGYPIKLDTNGSRPGMVRQLIDGGLIDYIAMDIKTDPQQYSQWIQENCRWEDILSSIEIILSSPLPHEFKTTCIRPLVEPETIACIAGHIQGSALYALQQCRDRLVLRPEFVKTRCRPYTSRELLHLKSIADPWVKTCIVR